MVLKAAVRVTIVRWNNITLTEQGSFVTAFTVRAGLDCLWVARWKNISMNPKWPHAQVGTPCTPCMNSADSCMYNTRYSIPWSECGPLIEKSHLLYWMSRRLHMFAKILGNVVRHCRNSCGGIPEMRRLSGTLFACGCCRLPCIWCSSVIDSSKNKVVEP